jgi:hypothetical protein
MHHIAPRGEAAGFNTFGGYMNIMLLTSIFELVSAAEVSSLLAGVNVEC